MSALFAEVHAFGPSVETRASPPVGEEDTWMAAGDQYVERDGVVADLPASLFGFTGDTFEGKM